MRSVVCALVFVIIIAVSAWAQSQAEMNENACDQAKKADAELNSVYSGVLKKQGNDKLFIEKLKAAQRIWIAFRDAEMAAYYPAKDKQSEYGTVFNMCYCYEFMDLTQQRTKQLKHWLDDMEEGNVCR